MKVSVCQCVCLCVLAIVALAIKIDSVIQNHIEKAFYHGGAAAAAFVSCMIDRRRDQFLYWADVYRGQRDCCNAMQS